MLIRFFHIIIVIILTQVKLLLFIGYMNLLGWMLIIERYLSKFSIKKFVIKKAKE